MAKDSDKNRVLERCRVQLLHAIRNEADQNDIEKRASKLLRAVLGVVKKHHVRYHPFQKLEENAEWKAVTDHWTRMNMDDVIAVVSQWSERPSYTDIFRACADKMSSSIQNMDQKIG